MVGLTVQEIFGEIVAACDASPIVSAFTVRVFDVDVLNLRVHLVDDVFIEVFINILTGKAAFALIDDHRRVYGKDNAKVGWHVHPWNDPAAHRPCPPISFEAFLSEVRAERFGDALPPPSEG